MNRLRWTRALSGALLLGAALCVRPAFADDPRDVARELANKGFEYYEAGDYRNAIQYLRDAEVRFHAPTLLLMLGKAHLKNGGLVEAKAAFQRVAEEELPADAPKEFQDAKVEAKTLYDDVKGRIATLKIILKGTTPDKVKITIDDVEVPTPQVSQPIPVNPGIRKIVASVGRDEGGRAVFQQVNLKEGVTKQIQLVFRAGGVIEPVQPQGGCASCEAGGRGGGGAPEGLMALTAMGIATAVRRRGRRSAG